MTETNTSKKSELLANLKEKHFDWINEKDIYVVNEDNLVIENDDKPIKLDLDNSYIKKLNDDCKNKIAISPTTINCHLNFKNSCQTHKCDTKIILPYKYLIAVNNDKIDEKQFNEEYIKAYKIDFIRNFSSAYFKINNEEIKWNKNELTNGITEENELQKNNNIYMLNLHNFLFKNRQEGGATNKEIKNIEKIKKILPIFTQTLQSELIDIIMKIMTNFEFLIQIPKYNYYINDDEIICYFFYPKDKIKINEFFLKGNDDITSESDLHIYLYIYLEENSFPNYYLRIYFDDNEFEIKVDNEDLTVGKYFYRNQGLTYKEAQKKKKALENNKILFV